MLNVSVCIDVGIYIPLKTLICSSSVLSDPVFHLLPYQAEENMDIFTKDIIK